MYELPEYEDFESYFKYLRDVEGLNEDEIFVLKCRRRGKKSFYL